MVYPVIGKRTSHLLHKVRIGAGDQPAFYAGRTGGTEEDGVNQPHHEVDH